MRLRTTLQSRRQGSQTGGTDDADGMGNRPKTERKWHLYRDAAQGRWLRAKHLKVAAWMKFPEAYKETET